MQLHHVAIAVRDLAAALESYRKLLLPRALPPIEEVPEEGVKVAFVELGDGDGAGARIELMEPLAPDSPVGRFISKRGEGIHHMAFAVGDCRAEVERLRAAGAPLLDPEPRLRGKGEHRRLVAFVHPKGANGVLIEVVQYLRGDTPLVPPGLGAGGHDNAA